MFLASEWRHHSKQNFLYFWINKNRRIWIWKFVWLCDDYKITCDIILTHWKVSNANLSVFVYQKIQEIPHPMTPWLTFHDTQWSTLPQKRICLGSIFIGSNSLNFNNALGGFWTDIQLFHSVRIFCWKGLRLHFEVMLCSQQKIYNQSIDLIRIAFDLF